MIIALDTKGYILTKNHGIGNYCVGIWKTLVKHDEHEFVLLTWGKKTIKDELFESDENVKEYIAGEMPADMEVVRFYVLDFLEHNKIDVYFDGCPMIGFGLDKMWFKDTLLVATVYDYIPYILKDKYFDKSSKYYDYIRRMYGNLQYDYLFSISENTRSDAIKIVGVDDNTIANIYMDVNTKELDRNCVCDNINMDLPKRFITSAVWFNVNKNIPRLLEGYGMAYNININIPDIVFTGGDRDRFSNQIEEIIDKYGMVNKVHFLGFLSNDEMDYLYSKSEWLVFPSLYEGFGMSVIEAWRHGVPVITSNTSSLFEIAHDAAVMVDPYDVDSICDGIIRATSMEESERKLFIDLGIERAKCFSWDKTARAFLDNVEKWMREYSFDIKDYTEKMRKIADGIKKESRVVIKNEYVEKCEKYYKDKKQIIVFGGGANGKKCVKMLSNIYKGKLEAICDNYLENNSSENAPVLKLKECIELFPEAHYIITPKYGREAIRIQLNEMGIMDNAISYFEAGKL